MLVLKDIVVLPWWGSETQKSGQYKVPLTIEKKISVQKLILRTLARLSLTVLLK